MSSAVGCVELTGRGQLENEPPRHALHSPRLTPDELKFSVQNTMSSIVTVDGSEDNSGCAEISCGKLLGKDIGDLRMDRCSRWKYFATLGKLREKFSAMGIFLDCIPQFRRRMQMFGEYLKFRLISIENPAFSRTRKICISYMP